MKKYIAMMMLATLATGMLIGCGKNSTSEFESESVVVEHLQSKLHDEYYMLAISLYTVDSEALLRFLIPEYEAYEEEATVTEEIGENADSEIVVDEVYSLSLNGEEYHWTLCKGRDDFFMWNVRLYDDKGGDTSVGIENDRLADQQAEDFVELLGVDTVLAQKEQHELQKTPGYITSYRYNQTYDGVEIEGDIIIDTGAKTVTGPLIEVQIDGKGYEAVSIRDVAIVDEILETYQSSEFLTLDVLKNRVQSYCVHMNSMVGAENVEVQAKIKEAEIVYLPYLNDNKSVLLPAYKLIVEETQGKENDDFRYIMDIFTGYVYDRMLISK